MQQNSIRWRLPASYALVALLAAVSLGSIMLLVLSNYYAGQERDYLYSNAIGLKPVIENLLWAGAPDKTLGEQVDTFAFFSQTQIRLLDAGSRAIADSGLPDLSQTMAISGAAFNGGPVISLSVPVTSSLPAAGLVVSNGNEQFGASPGAVFTTTLGAGGGLQSSTLQSAPMPAGAVHTFNTFVPLSASPYGYMFVSAAPANQSAQRSNQSVRLELQTASGAPAGWLEMSHGPAYGADIVRSVSLAWAAASLAAVALAALAGWFASRQFSGPVLALTETTLQMEQGNLSVRASLPGSRQAHEFQSLAHAFNAMAQRMEGTISTLRAFVSDAAHELNTPLTALRTNLELAHAAQSLAEKDEFLARAVDQNQRLERLASGLLDLSRIEAAHPGAPVSQFDLGSLAGESGERFAGRAEQANRQFSLALPAQPVWISGRQQQIQRLLENLLENALKFTPPGGSIHLELAQEAAWAVLTVSDTGIGIEAADLPHIFERFHRGRNTTGYPGSGLGLAIVKAIVDGHGGTVSADSGAPGATLTVRLPLAEN